MWSASTGGFRLMTPGKSLAIAARSKAIWIRQSYWQIGPPCGVALKTSCAAQVDAPGTSLILGTAFCQTLPLRMCARSPNLFTSTPYGPRLQGLEICDEREQESRAAGCTRNARFAERRS